MKLYEIILKPLSGFGTPLKGDTIFGHFCWQAAYNVDLLNGGLDRWIARYDKQPFAVFSSAWPKFQHNGKWHYAVKRPDMPLARFFPMPAGDKRNAMEERKENAAKKWMLVPEDLRLSLSADNFMTDHDILKLAFKELTDETKRRMRGRENRKLEKDFIQSHNTINRMTMTTGEGPFAPYTQTATFYYPETELALFVLIDEEATDIERVRAGLASIGQCGFGKDASTGWGRFEVAEEESLPLPDTAQADACYTLAPAVPQQKAFKNAFFTPFTRYGRHGDVMAKSRNPFKNPVIMADEGAVLVPSGKEIFAKPYLGRPVRNISKALPETVAQGYAPYLPFRMEG
ncbi:MAG: hypothetical protein C0394_00070 [Syntrophus sp. (in: bacteria)]|nr:hypothetical protein [Syntrophus sp. (in: bacteria)]